jgi:small subunit ribosomal protein S4
MSKVNKPKFKIYSKLGIKLRDHPKLISKKLTSKKWQSLYSFNRPPKKETEYGSLLKAKQRLKAFYGCSSDKQFKNLFVRSGVYKGNQTINFIKLLERRFDVFLLRSKISPSLREIHQFIQHGHFLINDSIVKNPSFLLKKGDIICVNTNSRNFIKLKVDNYLSSIVDNNKISKKKKINQIIKDNPILFTPNYIEFNHSIMKGQLIELPDVENICYSFNPDLTSLTEFYKYKKKL